MANNAKIIVISGPSGAGKTTLYKKVLANYKDDLGFSVSTTTRPPRTGEKEGIDYYYTTESNFKELIKNNEFIEWACVHNNYYGTLKSEIDRIISKKNKSCLLDLDVQGMRSMKKAFPECTLIFIVAPSIDELKKRLAKRKSDNAKIQALRIKNAIYEMEHVQNYDYQIVNDDVDVAYSELKELMGRIIEE